MRKLTLRGYLAKYLRTLSETETLDVAILAKEAAFASPRLKEPLFLYAILSGKSDRLIHHLPAVQLMHEFDTLRALDPADLEQALSSKTVILPEEYMKVFRSFESVRNRINHDRHTTSLMWRKITRLKADRHITNYRIYKDLHLNHGNLNRFLKHGDYSAVSLETARKVLQYLEKTAS